jgi:hypothetical protein
MRIRIVQKPPVDELDGINLRYFQVGSEYELGNTLSSVLLAEGWAEPVPLDAPAPPVPFGADDPFSMPVLDRSQPPNLVKEHHAQLRDRTVAADVRRRRKGR